MSVKKLNMKRKEKRGTFPYAIVSLGGKNQEMRRDENNRRRSGSQPSGSDGGTQVPRCNMGNLTRVRRGGNEREVNVHVGFLMWAKE